MKVRDRGRVNKFLSIAAIAILSAGFQSALPTAGASPGAQTMAGGESLTQFAAALSKRVDATVWIDPSLLVVGEAIHVDVTGGPEVALNQLTRQLPNSTWRRVYITREERTTEMSRLAAAVRGLERIDVRRIWLNNAAAHRTIELEREVPVTPVFHTALKANGFRKRPVYLVYKRIVSGDGMTAGERTIACERELAALLETSPGLQASATMQSMTWWMKLDPGSLQPLMQHLGSVGTDLWNNIEPSQRQEMMQQFKQTAMSASPPPGPPAASRSNAGDTATDRNYRYELERIARSLAARYGTEFAVDPSIYLTVRPVAPEQNVDEVAAVADLVRPLKGLVWCRFIVQPRPGSAPPGALQLANIARSLGRLSATRLAVEDPQTGTATLYSGDLPEGRGDKPTGTNGSLIYTEFADESGTPKPPAQRLVELMQREQQLMLAMDGHQLGQVLQHTVQSWKELDGPARERTMSLPIAAGLMAVWMPIDAKERSGR